MSIVAMAMWANALDNYSRMGGYPSYMDYEIQKKEQAAKEKAKAEKRYNPGLFSKMFGAERMKPGDIFERQYCDMSEKDRWLLEYELKGIKIGQSQGSYYTYVTKYTDKQVNDIVNLYKTNPEKAKLIRPYLFSGTMTPAELLSLSKKDPELFNLLRNFSIIRGNFDEMDSINSLDLKYLKPEYAAYKNRTIVKRLDEIASKSPEKAKIVDSITADNKFNYMFINSTDDKPEIVDKFVDFYAKDKNFINKLRTCTNSHFWNKIQSDVHDRKNKGKWLEYLVNVLEEFDKLEKKGIDKNQLLDGEMKPFTENRNPKVKDIDTLEYLKAKNKEKS